MTTWQATQNQITCPDDDDITVEDIVDVLLMDDLEGSECGSVEELDAELNG